MVAIHLSTPWNEGPRALGVSREVEGANRHDNPADDSAVAQEIAEGRVGAAGRKTLNRHPGRRAALWLARGCGRRRVAGALLLVAGSQRVLGHCRTGG